MTSTSESARLRTLLDTGIAISSELSLDGALERITRAAAELTGARYAALGVIDRTGAALERFITFGVDEETRATIGDLPRGRGILGVLIRDAVPLRLHDLNEDPRSVGFPPGHPEMGTFLGVPILLRGVAYGNLYLTEKASGEDFTEEDEELVTLLAAQAAVAVENARLYESATTWARQLESLNEIGNALVSELDLSRLLELIASRLRELIDARLVTIVLPAGETLRVEAAAGEDAAELIGATLPYGGSKTGRVFERRQAERIDSLLDDPEIHPETTRLFRARTGVYVPLVAGDEAIGVIVAHDKVGGDLRFSDADLRLAEQFGSRAATAVDLSRRVARDSLRRVVAGEELERQRLARELHDETGQALTSILLGLKTVEDTPPSELRAAVADLRQLVVSTLQNVRRLAVELRPKALDDFGLVAALERLVQTFAEATGIVAQLESRLGEERLPAEVETTLYRIVQETLTNIVKHADASNVSILLARRPRAVNVVVEDDGRGFDPTLSRATGGIGLLGIRERAELLDGRLTVESSVGRGTTVAVEVPLP
ncbi:MAG TPA: GAF domain-containing protein [Gaiellaceae bacterium]|nr:GAF domain-containing protein [Gaiellaceae bacterium]